jgi:poly(A) polymerase
MALRSKRRPNEQSASTPAEVTVCSGERIGAEMRRLLASPNAGRGIQTLHECHLAKPIMPRVGTGLDVDSKRLQLVRRFSRAESDSLAPRLALLALIAEEECQVALAELTERWKLANHEYEAAQFALNSFNDLLGAHRMAWSQLQPLLIQRYAKAAVELAKTMSTEFVEGPLGIQRVQESLTLPGEQLNPPPVLTGDDLKRLGYRPGPSFKSILDGARAAQLDGKVQTRTEAEQWLTQVWIAERMRERD